MPFQINFYWSILALACSSSILLTGVHNLSLVWAFLLLMLLLILTFGAMKLFLLYMATSKSDPEYWRSFYYRFTGLFNDIAIIASAFSIYSLLRALFFERITASAITIALFTLLTILAYHLLRRRLRTLGRDLNILDIKNPLQITVNILGLLLVIIIIVYAGLMAQQGGYLR